jgi:hypothetical protein
MDSSAPQQPPQSSDSLPQERDFVWLEKRLKEKFPNATSDDLRKAIRVASEVDKMDLH